MTRLSLCGCFAILLGSPALAQDAFFETSIRPVLANHCIACHGPDKQKSSLRVDSLAALIKGGKSGPAIQPGRPDDSLLIQAIRHGETLQMPPRKKLAAKEIADLTAWVKMGAPWPNAKAVQTPTPGVDDAEPAFTKEQLSHWAFQGIRQPKLPPVRKQAWVRSPVDAFILARCEEKGLTPVPAADPRTLVRRLYYDLIGLPPTPDEVEAFVKEADGLPTQRQAALEKVADRLLASPRYGERWARHWLDVVRYADSNGMDENLVFGNAWRFRDYVINAFNTDKPYDQFVREQLAGDLPSAKSTSDASAGMIATAFLCVGPKMLAEDDPVKMEMDIIDEQVDTMGRAFMGLTLGCVRCHDHKYDPFTMADYYGLAGIFKSTKTMDHFRVVARWQERPLGMPADVAKSKSHAQKMATLKERINEMVLRHYQEMIQPARKRAQEYWQTALVLKKQGKVELRSILARAKDKVPGLILIEAEDFARGNVIKTAQGYGEKIGVIYNKGELPNVAEYDIDVKEAGTFQLELRYAAADARPVQVFVNGNLTPTLAATQVTGSWYPDTQTWFAESSLALKMGRNVLLLKRAGPFPHIDKLALVPRMLEPDAPKTLEQRAQEANLNQEFLRQWLEYLQNNPGPKDPGDLEKIASLEKGPFRFAAPLEASFAAAVQKELRDKRAQLVALEKSAPVLAEAMAVSEGTPTNLRIHLRGNHLTLGKEAPRRLPTLFAGRIGNPSTEPTESGRLRLAHWLTQSDHPLTSRVMVNRLWHWHFGTGLVRSVDNFGLLGDKPSHPELLDWLAHRFVESGWSIKAMHRLIVLSNTYQMSGAYSEAAFHIDPDNRLHWRHSRRRMEAEALRDSLYALGGNLDLSMGGTLFEAKNRVYVPGYPNANYEKYDIPRRSIYLPVIRSALYDVFQAFDFADPSFASGERVTTTVAPQALFLMNGKIVDEQTRAWSAKLLGNASLDDAGRIRRIYQQAFARPPSAGELARAQEFVERIESEWARMKMADARARAWHHLCRVIVAANEFVYVD